MVDYDVKLLVSVENKEKLIEKGLTQLMSFTSFDSAISWYIGQDEWYESFLENDVPEDEAEIKTKMLCDKRKIFDKLIDKVFPCGCVYFYANKKSSHDEIGDIFDNDDFWGALESMEKWITSLNIEYLQFENDDLSGWALTRWGVNKERSDFEIIKELIEEAKNVGGV